MTLTYLNNLEILMDEIDDCHNEGYDEYQIEDDIDCCPRCCGRGCNECLMIDW